MSSDVDRAFVVRRVLLRRELLAFVPALALSGYWFGLPGLALVTCTALAVSWLTRGETSAAPPVGIAVDAQTRLPPRAAAEAVLDAALRDCLTTGRGCAAFVLGLDDFGALAERHGEAALAQVLKRMGERLHSALREGDLVAGLPDGRFAVALAPVHRFDLESVIQIATRLQAAAEAPMSLDAATLHPSAHIGFCLISRSPERNGPAMLRAAEIAADAALRHGPGSVRAFSTEIEQQAQDRHALADQVAAALEGGQIVAHFLPQISCDTGAVTGFELVPCWLHPARSCMDGAELLQLLDAGGLRKRLGEVLMYHGFAALRGRYGTGLPKLPLTLALSHDDLGDPKLPDRLSWELDRFEIAPALLRLLLPDLPGGDAASGQDTAQRNLARLAALGCGLELSGIGNGIGAISAMRRFNVQRIRIPPALVRRIDADAEQQRLVAAVVSLADGLGAETLAEGVSGLGEHTLLAQLGCSHVQGPGIARVMAVEDARDWLNRHQAKRNPAPRIGRPRR